MNTYTSAVEQKVQGFCLLTAPLLFALSTFFWVDGQYGVTGGTLLVLSIVFWIPAFIALFGLLKSRMPVYASIGLLVAIYGCISGVNFGFAGFYASVFDISHKAFIEAFPRYPTPFNLLLFWSGPLFPLSLLVLGINLIRSRTTSLWVGIFICLGAIAFPLSRISRTEWIAHVADFLLLLPIAYTGILFLFRKQMSF